MVTRLSRLLDWTAGFGLSLAVLLAIAVCIFAGHVHHLITVEQAGVLDTREELIRRMRESEEMGSRRQAIAALQAHEQALRLPWDGFSFGEPPIDSLALTAAIQSFVHESKARLRAVGIAAEKVGSFGFDSFVGEVAFDDSEGELEATHREMILAKALLDELMDAAPQELMAFECVRNPSTAPDLLNPRQGANAGKLENAPPAGFRIRVTGNSEFLRAFLSGMRDRFIPCALAALTVAPLPKASEDAVINAHLVQPGLRSAGDTDVFHRLSIPLMREDHESERKESACVVEAQLSEFDMVFVRTDEWTCPPAVGRYDFGSSSHESWMPPMAQGPDGTWRYEVFSPPRIFIHPGTGEFDSDAYVEPSMVAFPEIRSVVISRIPFRWQLVGFVESEVAGRYVLLLRDLQNAKVIRYSPGEEPAGSIGLPEILSFEVRKCPGSDGSLQSVGVLNVRDSETRGSVVLSSAEMAFSDQTLIGFEVGDEPFKIRSAEDVVDFGDFEIRLLGMRASGALCEWAVRHRPTDEVRTVTSEYREDRP